MRKRPDNELRFDPTDELGHVESYFMRGNHPTRPLAFWLKATIFAPRPGSAVAELWCVVFDGEKHRSWAGKHTVPYSHARYEGDPMAITVGPGTFHLDADGHTAGSLSALEGPCKWDLSWRRAPGLLGSPLCMLPWDAMVEARFPKSKLLTPYPLLKFTGTLEVWGETFEVADWVGMQGHNWGREHAWEYAWGQCNFTDDAGEPFCSAEGFSGRLRLAGRATPFLSALVVRRGEREYRFDRVFDFWRQEASVDDLRWTVALKSSDGEARMTMQASARDMVCLGYHNPDGRLSYCLNSKLARVELRVNPTNEEGFEVLSEHGGALEFLRNAPDARFAEVV